MQTIATGSVSATLTLRQLLVALAVLVFAVTAWSGVWQGTGTAFEWTTVQDVPSHLRAVDPGFNPDDFYTNNFIHAPRDGFLAAIGLTTWMGLSWETGLYLLKVAMTLVRPLLLFAILALLARHICVAEGRLDLMRPALIAAGGIAAMTEPLGHWFTFAEWPMLHAGDAVTPAFLSATLALVFFALVVARPSGALWLGPKLVVAAGVSFMHPAVGLATLAWLPLLLILMSGDWRIIARDLTLYGAAFVLPVLATLVLYGEPGAGMSAEAFRDLYVRWRHAWHYDPAMAYGLVTGGPVLIALVVATVLLAVQARAWRVLVAVGFGVSVVAGTLLFHWAGTDLVPIKAVMKLGATRFVAFAPLFTLLTLFAAGVTRFARLGDAGQARDPGVVPRIGGALAAVTAASLVLAAPVAALTFKDAPHQKDLRALGAWLPANTAQGAVIADMNIAPGDGTMIPFHNSDLTHVVRIFGGRPVFADKAYTFTESSTVEFRDRQITNARMATVPLEEVACAARPFTVDYAVYFDRHPMAPVGVAPVFESGPISLYSVPPAGNCGGEG